MNLRLRHYLTALLLHAILFSFVFIGVRCSHISQPPIAIQGTLVSPSQVKQLKEAVQQQPVEDKQKAIDEAKHQADLAAEAQQREKQQAELKQKQAQEQQKKAAAEAAAQAKKQTEQKAALQKQVQAQQKAEADKQAKLKQQQVAAKKAAAKQEAEQKATQAAAAEKAKQEAQEKAAAEAKQKAAEAAKQKAEQEAKAKAAAAAKAEAAKKQAALQKQREAEMQRQLGSEAQALKQSAQNAWIGAITAKMASNWLRPPGVSDTIVCTVRVQLASSGHVLSVVIVSSSGNSLFDDSVRRAVLKSDPFPLPADPTAFDPNLNLTFHPQDLQNAG